MPIEADHLTIRFALARKGYSLAAVAREAQVSRQHVSDVVRGKRRNIRIRRLITQWAGMPFASLWGDDAPGMEPVTAQVDNATAQEPT